MSALNCIFCELLNQSN